MARSVIDFVQSGVAESVRRGLIHRGATGTDTDGRRIRVNDRNLLHFGSCSYLGLELDERLKRSAMEAAERHGTQFSSSRAYVSTPLYAELEDRLAQIFEAHVIATPSTTLGHLAAIPTLVEPKDAAILDHQVHHSVQMASQVARGEGALVELHPHNDLERLDERVRELSHERRKIWYLADGVYSMYGDLAPMKELTELLAMHPQLHVYVDDAHGMSWAGERGSGVVLSQVPLHPRMVLATSLNKSFAAGGGCLVFPDAEQLRRVRSVGGPMIFSGPIQPPMLGAGVASAEIHLSGDLERLQAGLTARIQLCNRLIEERDLPLVSNAATPVRFIGVGSPKVARSLAARLFEAGFFVNLAHFPAVPTKQAGIRFTITRHQQPEDIVALADALERHLPAAMRDAGQSVSDAWASFGLRPRRSTGARPRVDVQTASTIEALSPEEWNRFFGDRGILRWDGLRSLERVFVDCDRPEQAWQFRYFIVRDAQGAPLAATVFTLADWKLDMMSSAQTSALVEERRQRDPRLLVRPVFGMGTLLTEGSHLAIDAQRLPHGGPAWQAAMTALLSAARQEAEALGSDIVALRDFDDDPVFDEFFVGYGYTRMDGPDRHAAAVAPTEAAQIEAVNRKARQHQRRYVAPWNDRYRVSVHCAADGPLPAEWSAHLEALYENVKASSLELNTFPLPQGFFAELAADPHAGWELLLLTPSERSDPDALPVAFVLCFAGDTRFVPAVIGLDYDWVRDRGLYRQALRAIVARARALGLATVEFGMSASLEKRRFGATATATRIYLQANDLYPFELLGSIDAEAEVARRDR